MIVQYFVSSFILTFEINLIVVAGMISPAFSYVTLYVALIVIGLLLGFLYMIVMKKLLVDLKIKYHFIIGVVLGLIAILWIYMNIIFISSTFELIFAAEEMLGYFEIPNLNIMIASYFIPFILPFIFRILRK